MFLSYNNVMFNLRPSKMFEKTHSVQDSKKKPPILNTLCNLDKIKRRMSIFFRVISVFFLTYLGPSVQDMSKKNPVKYVVLDLIKITFFSFKIRPFENRIFCKKVKF